MAVDGTYQVSIETPLGAMKATIILTTDGSSLSGSADGKVGHAEFSGGTVNGQEAAWTMSIKTPIGKMDLACAVTIDGDNLTGEVKAGNFGSFPIEGERVI